ncbi:hypothetical protein JW851_01735 [Candidatus Woesearchaeota archaeon]|nr:hypothetical protein [Candidatus Woesearchaeota archaeon]
MRKSKVLNSIIDYISVGLYIKGIKSTHHYRQNHLKEVPWEKVLELITTTKNPRKQGNKFEIKKQGYYILFEIKNKRAFVINAKKTK